MAVSAKMPRFSALRELPDVHADLDSCKPAKGSVGRGHDAEVNLQVGGMSFTMLVEVKKTVFSAMPAK